MHLNRRLFAFASAASLSVAMDGIAAGRTDTSRLEGMLIGSLIGDALGGPIEFLSTDRVREVMPGARGWNKAKRLDAETIAELADSLAMESYETLRPTTAPYGPWKRNAPRGTITDDSRHKIVLMRAIQAMLRGQRSEFSAEDLARAFIAFRPRLKGTLDDELTTLVEQGLREYRFAARWLLGERDPDMALPVERLWAGISNCSGQMALLPLAGIFAGEPEQAYRATYRVDFIDAPIARDIVSAINAGLAAALGSGSDDQSMLERWTLLLDTMRETDPLRMRDVPFAGRPLDRWLDLSDSIASRADGRPAKAYELLETEGKPVYWWDAHFTLLVPLTMLKLCRFNPLAAMHLTLDFGHDTDSYAQVLGALAGAVHGKDIFPESMRTAVSERLTADYGESIDDWMNTLNQAAIRRQEAIAKE
ncbi:MAG: ADP-ribosylglycohydrolase family protein [Planctomycetota bacterium]